MPLRTAACWRNARSSSLKKGKRILPFVMVDPMRCTDAQAAELIKLRSEYRFHGIKIQSTIIQADIKRLAHEGQVFLDLAREWDVPSHHPQQCRQRRPLGPGA